MPVSAQLAHVYPNRQTGTDNMHLPDIIPDTQTLCSCFIPHHNTSLFLIIFFCRAHFIMGGGNAQKSAKAREKKMENAKKQGAGGGGAAAIVERGGDTAGKMKAAQDERKASGFCVSFPDFFSSLSPSPYTKTNHHSGCCFHLFFVASHSQRIKEENAAKKLAKQAKDAKLAAKMRKK